MNDTVSLVIVILSAAFYFIAAVMHFFKKTDKASNIVWILGVACNAAIVVNNWLVNGYVPFVSMYQVLTFLSLVFAPIFLYIKYLHRGDWMAKYFCFAAAICMIGV